MYAKVINNEVIKYPYNIEELKKDNPNVLFFVPLDPDTKTEYNIVDVYDVPPPVANWNQKVIEGQPVKRGDIWVRSWSIADRPLEECLAEGKELRKQAYSNEADPLFFKAQRGEATMQQWLDKVEEIKQRFSY